MSVTKDGIFSQEDFFKKQIASKNNIGYKIIRKNNLVFSTMNLWMGSLDVLTNYDIGIVSPAYIVLSMDETLDLGWDLLCTLPKSELDRIDEKLLDEKYDPARAARFLDDAPKNGEKKDD